MSQLVTPYFADGTPATIAVDGVTYRVARVDGDGRQIVTLDVDGDVLTYFNANYAAAQTNTQLVAAPGAGLTLHLCWFEFSCDAAMNMKFTQSSGVPADLMGPHYFAANSGHGPSRMSPPVALNANSALRITTVGAGNATISGVCVTR